MNRNSSSLSIPELFRIEAENQTKALISGLLALERSPAALEPLEACMRAAHSLKGAARIVNLAAGVELAHAMEDCFVAAQEGRFSLQHLQIDLLLRGADLMMSLALALDAERKRPEGQKNLEVASFLEKLTSILEQTDEQSSSGSFTSLSSGMHADESTEENSAASPPAIVFDESIQTPSDLNASDGVLRITADNLNRLVGLAGESLVVSRQLKPFVEAVLKIKRMQNNSLRTINDLLDALPQHVKDGKDERIHASVIAVRHMAMECERVLSQRLVELEMLDHRSTNLAQRLYDQALACRMRPFVDGVHRFPRMVRDLGHTLGKRIRLDIAGASTQVDREILEKLDVPLTHLISNAIDHGIELPEERIASGKPPEAVIRLEARHNAGMLQITVSDDGRGIDLEQLRASVVKRQLSNAEMAEKLSESELLEFLFLPGFSMKETLTQLSGRGVGLDIVQNMIKRVHGVVIASSFPNKGTQFQLQLPLTLSVIRTLIVSINDELYAFPLAHIIRTLKIPKEQVASIEGRQHFDFNGKRVGLATAHQILEGNDASIDSNELSIIVAGDQQNMYGVVVDRFIGQRELVIQPFDARLGKMRNISAAALMEDGSPVLVIDVEDMLRSLEKIVSTGHLRSVQSVAREALKKQNKRVLVVDDSLTVRELERKLLAQHGYEVEVAVDGMDGWNVIRTSHFDLIITDIDMPRMDGIELIKLIRQNADLKSRPVMIVSYKDREEDRQRGLEAGADYYLTKGSFHDETLLHAVIDLIGEADA